MGVSSYSEHNRYSLPRIYPWDGAVMTEYAKGWARKNKEKIKEYGRRYYARHKDRIQARVDKEKNKVRYRKRRSTIRGRVVDTISKAKRRCEKKGIPFDLTKEHLINLWETQQGKCSITNMAMSLENGIGRLPIAASLDRINPTKGYVKSNVRWICDIVNIMKSNLTDKELETWSLRTWQGLRNRPNIVVPNLSSFADAVDRLIVELLKLSYFENEKRKEQGKKSKDVHLIAKWDDLSRDSCEYRSALKNEINRMLKEIVASQSYLPLEELRTFRAPSKSVDELIEEMIGNRINEEAKDELIQSLLKELKQ